MAADWAEDRSAMDLFLVFCLFLVFFFFLLTGDGDTAVKSMHEPPESSSSEEKESTESRRFENMFVAAETGPSDQTPLHWVPLDPFTIKQ